MMMGGLTVVGIVQGLELDRLAVLMMLNDVDLLKRVLLVETNEFVVLLGVVREIVTLVVTFGSCI